MKLFNQQIIYNDTYNFIFFNLNLLILLKFIRIFPEYKTETP